MSTAVPRGVIFDVDGVLVDSYQVHLRNWQAMARGVGKELTEAEFQPTFGRVSREIIPALWGADFMTEAEIAEFDRRKEARYRAAVAADFPAMEGARDLILALHDAGMRIAIGSSGPPENVNLTVDALCVREVVQTLVTGADVSRGKPDPEVFLLAAERLGVDPAHCAVVEDSPPGISAANAAGMTSIALLSAGHTRASVAHARHLVLSLRDLSPGKIAAWIAASR